MTKSKVRFAVALLAEGVDRNLGKLWVGRHRPQSPSSRRAWIEIVPSSPRPPAPRVALLAEGVDRNSVLDAHIVKRTFVALLAEGVDRNWERRLKVLFLAAVALLAEGVDRNLLTPLL